MTFSVSGVLVGISDRDAWALWGFRWCLHTDKNSPHLVYARTEKRGRKIMLHRIIVGARQGEIVDHINGNTLDNRRENLRICTNAENGQNRHHKSRGKTSGFIGIHFCKRSNRWLARVQRFGKRVLIGHFKTESAAADARTTFLGGQ